MKPRSKTVTRKGKKFGRLKTLERVVGVKRKVRCVCTCGTEKEVWLPSLRQGHIVSCGCYRTEKAATRRPDSKERLQAYKAWHAAVTRCTKITDPAYPRYGGRGVTVCDEWKSLKIGFENFLTEVSLPPSPKHTLERKDNSKGYEPGNCRWATMKEQGRNRATNRKLTIDGKTKLVVEWGELCPAGYALFRQRIIRGWNPDRAFNTPKQK